MAVSALSSSQHCYYLCGCPSIPTLLNGRSNEDSNFSTSSPFDTIFASSTVNPSPYSNVLGSCCRVLFIFTAIRFLRPYNFRNISVFTTSSWINCYTEFSILSSFCLGMLRIMFNLIKICSYCLSGSFFSTFYLNFHVYIYIFYLLISTFFFGFFLELVR